MLRRRGKQGGTCGGGDWCGIDGSAVALEVEEIGAVLRQRDGRMARRRACGGSATAIRGGALDGEAEEVTLRRRGRRGGTCGGGDWCGGGGGAMVAGTMEAARVWWKTRCWGRGIGQDFVRIRMAASMNVHVGSFYDPDGLEGLSHLLCYYLKLSEYSDIGFAKFFVNPVITPMTLCKLFIVLVHPDPASIPMF
ncbi:hypothetical protein E2562_015008 [Oryza meyeriana var. granulata]|uniref:Peptidase M16 N-terminal domain-containing protein n=1 Tax=Oryza meyeriana var. granulata TaxID=110450 RepID=A0A6G1EJF9_9ORYZ|nr:hypothetical protein E2562_015008 [Oryza meyeriana var. granulata]